MSLICSQSRAELRDGPAGQLPGALRRHGNYCNYGASKPM